jgi:hypothetical protein
MKVKELFEYGMGTTYDNILQNALRAVSNRNRARVGRTPIKAIGGAEPRTSIGSSNMSWGEALNELGVHVDAPVEAQVGAPSYQDMRRVLQSYIEMRTRGGRDSDERLDRHGIKHLADVVSRWQQEVEQLSNR